MLTAKRLVATAAGFLLLIGTARSDWNEGDPYKMVHPQLPDTNRWDVSPQAEGAFTMLADDRVCSESGYVKDIQMWYSWKEDTQHTFGVELTGADSGTVGWKTSIDTNGAAAVWLDTSNPNYVWRQSKDQFFVPRALERMAFSMRLLSISNTPSSTNRVSASQRFKA